jgi:hypothetical protein
MAKIALTIFYALVFLVWELRRDKMTKIALSVIYMLAVLALVSVVATLCGGCEDNYEIWISDSCTDHEVGLVDIAVAEVKRGLGDEVVVKGVREKPEGPACNDDIDMVICVRDSENGRPIGWVRQNDIFLSTNKIDTDDRFVSVLLHEFGHYIGKEYASNGEHVNGEENVMYFKSARIPVVRYTDVDREAIHN